MGLRWPPSTPEVRDLILGGAAKAGTSALATALARHPDLHLSPRKEAHVHLFADGPPQFCGPGDDVLAAMVVSDAQVWAAERRAADGAAVFGEASVYYLYRPESWPAIAAAVHDPHVVLVLRDPVTRVISAWGHLVREGREPLPLEAALDAEADRRAAGWEWCWRYRDVSRYERQLPAVLDAIGRERLLVVDHAELQRTPDEVLARIHRFLGLEERPTTAVHEVNPSGVVRSRRVHRFLTEPHPVKDALRPLVPDAVVQATYRTVLRRNLKPLDAVPGDVRAELARDLAPTAAGVAELVGLDTRRWCAPPEG